MPLTVPGRRVLVISALLVASIAGVAGRWMMTERPLPGPYLDAVALDGDFVVAIRDERHSHRAFVELVALGEGMRWQALIPSYDAEGGPGVAASEHALSVRFPRNERAQVFAFSAQTARKVGALNLGYDLPPQADGYRGAVVTLSAGPMSYEILHPDGKPARLYAVSHYTGGVVWWKDLPAAVESGMVTPDHVIFQHPDAVTAIARDGAAVTEPDAARACAIPGLAGGHDVLVVGRQGGVELVELDAGAVAGRTRVEGVGALAGPCGRRGGSVYVAVAGGAVVEIVDGAVARRIELGGEVRAVRWPDAPLAAPFSGELGRVEPIATRDGLAGVDLQSGAIVWRRPLGDDAAVVDTGDRVLVRTADRLASIDVTTGQERAVRVPADAAPLRAHHVAGDAVWVVDPHGLTSLDVRTLELRGIWRQPGEITAL